MKLLLVCLAAILAVASATWIQPKSVVTATCISTQRPNGSNNAWGRNDPGAVGGEPGGTCNKNEKPNAAALLKGGATYFRAASGSLKEYYFIYDFGAHYYIDNLQLEGTSWGYWCEDGQLGGSYCHNDNGFAVAFSNDGSNWSGYNQGFSTTDYCGRLDDGCGWTFSSRRVRYMKLAAISSCAGCSNHDRMTKIRAQVTPPTAAPTMSPTGVHQAELEFAMDNGRACSFSYDGTRLHTGCALGNSFTTATPASFPRREDTELMFAYGGNNCTIAFTGSNLETDCMLGSGFPAGNGGSLLGAKMRFIDGNNICALNYDGNKLNTDCPLGHGF